MGTETAIQEVAAPHGLSFWGRPPGWHFHLALVPPSLGFLWSHSYPGVELFSWWASTLLLVLAALVWCGRAVTYRRAMRAGRSDCRPRSFAVAPAAGLLVLALVLIEAPLQARWALSRSAFEEVVAEALRDDEYASNENRRVGLYEVTSVYRQGDAVIFRERTGVITRNAGFAHLPDGPAPELEHGGFERPQFRHLGGHWYAWTASW